MSYMFGVGKGHLGRKAERIAKKHGAQLVNYTDPGCSYGRGCQGHEECPANARHWFEAQNLGSPFDERVRDSVLAELASNNERSAIMKRAIKE